MGGERKCSCGSLSIPRHSPFLPLPLGDGMTEKLGMLTFPSPFEGWCHVFGSGGQEIIRERSERKNVLDTHIKLTCGTSKLIIVAMHYCYVVLLQLNQFCTENVLYA